MKMCLKGYTTYGSVYIKPTGNLSEVECAFGAAQPRFSGEFQALTFWGRSREKFVGLLKHENLGGYGGQICGSFQA